MAHPTALGVVVGRTVLACRVLVDRREPGSVVQVEWYPTRVDSRKRPD